MKPIFLLLSSRILVGCATPKDPVWSDFYYPQEVLLKPAPKAEPSRVQGKSTFLQNEAEFKAIGSTLANIGMGPALGMLCYQDSIVVST
jgi:hypothetical protein